MVSVSNDKYREPFSISCTKMMFDASNDDFNFTLRTSPWLGIPNASTLVGITNLPTWKGVIVFGSSFNTFTLARSCFAVFYPFSSSCEPDENLVTFVMQAQHVADSSTYRFNPAMCRLVHHVIDAGQAAIFALKGDSELMVAVGQKRDLSYVRQPLRAVATGLSAANEVTAGYVDLVSSTVFVTACLVFISASTGSYECNVIKFSLIGTTSTSISYLELIGLQLIPYSGLATDMRPSASMTLYVLVSDMNGLALMRLLMWDVSAVYPVLADYQGGVVVTVTGSGFRKIPRTAAACQFSSTAGSKVVQATYVNSSQLLCIAPPEDVTTVCQHYNFVSVSLSCPNLSPDCVFTADTPSAQVERTQTPIVSSASPGRVAARVSGLYGQRITIHGINFLPSDVLTCMFASPSATHLASLYSSGSYVSTTTVLCSVPNVTEGTPTDWRLYVSLDGFVYSVSSAPFVVVGIADHAVFVQDTMTIGSAMQQFVLVEVVVQDKEGNAVSSFDTTPYAFQLAPVADSSPLMPILYGSAHAVAKEGYAVFNAVYVAKPLATNATVPPIRYELICISASSLNNQLLGNPILSITIVAGSPSALIIVSQPGKTVDSLGLDPYSADPSVSCVDAAGNVLTEASAGLAPLVVIASPIEVLGPDFPNVTSSSLLPIIPNANLTRRFFNGRATFHGIVVHARFAATYFLNFAVVDRPEIVPVNSSAISGSCATGYFQVPGQYECSQCLEFSTCDGQNLTVLPEYWRSSVASTFVYQCQSGIACPGGPPGSCTYPYTGPLCQQCVSGYGKSIRGACAACTSKAWSTALVLGTLAGMTVMLTLIVVFSLQNTRSSNLALTIVQLFVHQFQLLSILSILDTSYPSYFRTIIDIVNAFAGVQFLDTAFGACFLSSYELSLRSKYILQVLMILEIPLTAFLARSVIFLWPSALRRRSAPGKFILRPEIKLNNARIAICSFLVCSTFLYQAIVLYSTEMWNCRTIDYGTYAVRVLVADVTLNCDSSETRAAANLAYGVCAAVLLGVPCMFAILYMRLDKRGGSSSAGIRNQYLAFYLDAFKQGSWWWNILILLRKGLMIVVAVLNSYPIDAQVSSWILVLYASSLVYIRPFYKPLHFTAEAIGVLGTYVCISLSTLTHSANSSTVDVSSIVTPIIVAIESIVFLYYGSLLWTKLRHKLWATFQVGFEPGSSEDVAEVDMEMRSLDGKVLSVPVVEVRRGAAASRAQASDNDDTDDDDDDLQPPVPFRRRRTASFAAYEAPSYPNRIRLQQSPSATNGSPSFRRPSASRLARQPSAVAESNLFRRPERAPVVAPQLLELDLLDSNLSVVELAAQLDRIGATRAYSSLSSPLPHRPGGGYRPYVSASSRDQSAKTDED